MYKNLNVSLCDILLSLDLKFKEQGRDVSECDTERDCILSPTRGEEEQQGLLSPRDGHHGNHNANSKN